MRDVASRRRRSSTVCHSYGAGFILHHAWGDGLLEIEMPNQDIYNNNKCVCVCHNNKTPLMILYGPTFTLLCWLSSHDQVGW